MRVRLVVAASLVSLCLFTSLPARADDSAKTRYPIVMAHGMAGFSSLFGVLDYFYGVPSALSDAGGTIYVTQVSAFASTEARGEQLLAQVEEIVARTGARKVNLVGHSHGGLDARYVAAVRPDLVASVTTVGTPHRGAELAAFLRRHISEGGVTESVLAYFTGHLGKLLAVLSGQSRPQDAIAGLEALTPASLAGFNARYPAGLPATPCGSRPQTPGARYYSWSGTDPGTNLVDTSDAMLRLASAVYGEANDGLVGRCSSHFGEVIRDDFRMNHFDEVNQVLGLTALFETNPRSVFRAHANRLRLAGL